MLIKMQSTLGKYAELLSQILKVDVEIVDLNLFRVAGTGRFKNRINMDASKESYVFREIIESGKSKVIDHPGEDSICKSCGKYKHCDETFEMCTPIIYGKKVIGAIGLVCFTESQREHILSNFETFKLFLDQISDLIVSKLIEIDESERNSEVNELFKSIFEKSNEGILVFDEDYRIKEFNLTSERILKDLTDLKTNLNLNLIKTGEKILNYNEYIIKKDEKELKIAGNLYRLTTDQLYRVLIFKDYMELKSDLEILKNKPKSGLELIIGHSEPIESLKAKIKMVASSTSTVLITGESGTGKEVFARALHDESDRFDGPFVAINCAAIPENLIESELFGYVNGAFTGANPKGKMGKFELANNGTLLLDEIGDMPLFIQAKLLRALEDKKITRLGDNTSSKFDVRIIASTNKDMEQLIKKQMFREDLFYRLNVIPLKIPSLRERGNDVRLLAIYFIKLFSNQLGKKVVRIEDGFWRDIEKYAWMGNVRELQNVIEYMINMLEDDGLIKESLLPDKIKSVVSRIDYETLNIEEMEKRLIRSALEQYGRSGESKKIVAQKLGIGIATLYRKMDKYEIER